MTTVSVIMPTYNRPGLLERALRSVYAQTFQDYEIIVVNDAGMPVWDVVKQFPKTTLIEHQENKGLPASRNTGIRAAKGKYIAFLDDDDLYCPIHLQTLVRVLEQGYRAAYTDAYWWIREEMPEVHIHTDFSRQKLEKSNLFPVMTVMLDATLLKDHKFDESLKSHEDYDLWLTLSNYTHFVHIPFFTAIYSKRGGDDQITSTNYHASHFQVVRKKHGIDHIKPLWLEKERVIVTAAQAFNANIDGESVPLQPGECAAMKVAVAQDYLRAGLIILGGRIEK